MNYQVCRKIIDLLYHIGNNKVHASRHTAFIYQCYPGTILFYHPSSPMITWHCKWLHTTAHHITSPAARSDLLHHFAKDIKPQLVSSSSQYDNNNVGVCSIFDGPESLFCATNSASYHLQKCTILFLTLSHGTLWVSLFLLETVFVWSVGQKGFPMCGNLNCCLVGTICYVDIPTLFGWLKNDLRCKQ